MGSWRDIYPQAFGLLPWPYTIMIVPFIPNWQEALPKILRFDLSDLPKEWSFLEHIYKGEFESAEKALSEISEPDVKNYNLFLLHTSTGRVSMGDRESYKIKDKTLNFITSLINSDDLNGADIVHKDLRDDVTAVVNFILYQIKRAQRDIESALKYLDKAIVLINDSNPVFKARLLLEKARSLQESKGTSYALIQLFQEVIELVRDLEVKDVLGEAYFHLGNAYSAFGNIQEATTHYYKALDYFTEETNPYMFALIHNNLGLTYLSTPAVDIEDQVRLALGVQHLKKALTIFTKDTYPTEWASATMNYANALQYLPTANPLKNLLKAVDLYQEVIEFRRQVGDEVGYARAMANLGNALAHLGRLAEAREKLNKAKEIFAKYGMKDEIEGVSEILIEIANTEAGHE